MQYELKFEGEVSPKPKPTTYYDVAKERMALYGSGHLDMQQIYAILIGRTASPELTGRIASIDMKKLSKMSVYELQKIKGVTELLATKIFAIFELARRHNRIIMDDEITIRSPDDAASVFRYLNDFDQEVFAVAYLNTKNQVIHRKEIFVGTLNSSVVHPREVYQEALKVGGVASIICAHQHPSGDPFPSDEDKHVCLRLKKAGEIIGIQQLDFLTIGRKSVRNSFISFKEKGYM